MKILRVTTQPISVPLKRPFVTALRSAAAIESVLIRVETDGGAEGLGEAAATAAITGETRQSIAAAVEGHIAPAIAGRDILAFDDVMRALRGCIVKNTSAKAAVDMALYDLLAQRLGVPLYQLLGGARSSLVTDVTISLADTPRMVADSLAAVAEGFSILKLKVGRSAAGQAAEPCGEARKVAEIRAAVGPEVELRVDANQGWLPKEAVRIIRAMEDAGCGASLVEQPVRAGDVDGLRFVTQNVSTPILADEAVFSPADALEILRTRAADLINIKLMKTGGIHQALAVCAMAESYGVACMMGCMLESRLAVSAAAHLAAAKGVITMCDLDGPSLCASDIYEDGTPVGPEPSSADGPKFKSQDIIMGSSPGIGVRLMPE
ncbi:MAG: dipeptide epimerase [Clostridiales bacterium]|nr:dipeptide epimerase [Clostridiales bacterium]